MGWLILLNAKKQWSYEKKFIKQAEKTRLPKGKRVFVM